MLDHSLNLDVIRRYLKAIEDGNFSIIAGLFTDDMTLEQLPNRIYPQGLRSNITKAAEGFEMGRKLLSSQTYEIKNAVVHENSVAVEVLWTGTLAIAFGNLTAGSRMRAHSAMFFEFNDGKISSQRNYDCFEPW
jgi:ketosteroid isomerase-like protein